MKKSWCYFGGKITTLDKVKISPYDIGLLRGYGVFDVMAAFNRKPFILEAHYKRLVNSAKKLKLKLPVSQKEYREIIEKLILKNGHKDSTIRTIFTGGISSDAFSIGSPTFFILVEKFLYLPNAIYEKGAKVITHEFERYCPEAKITNYVEAIRHQDVKKKKGALEIVFVKEGKVLEASTSNIFFCNGKKLVTTKEKILLGTTRNLVIELAKKNGFSVEEREFSLEELFEAEEVFLTATNKNIVPIVKVDDKKIGQGKVGEKTQELMKILTEYIKKY